MANAKKENVKRFIEDISKKVANDAYNGGGSQGGVYDLVFYATFEDESNYTVEVNAEDAIKVIKKLEAFEPVNIAISNKSIYMGTKVDFGTINKLEDISEIWLSTYEPEVTVDQHLLNARIIFGGSIGTFNSAQSYKDYHWVLQLVSLDFSPEATPIDDTYGYNLFAEQNS